MNNKYDNVSLMSWILNNITGMPNILNISEPREIDRTPPILNPDSIKINATDSTINLTNISINKGGFLYVSVEPIEGNISNFFHNLTRNNTLFKSLPNNTKNQTLIEYINQYLLSNLSHITWVQIKDGLTSDQAINSIKSRRFLFNSSNEIIENITFFGLTNETFYRISMFATAEDPSYFAPKTDIFQWIQNTTSIQRLVLFEIKLMINLFIFCLSIMILNI